MRHLIFAALVVATASCGGSPLESSGAAPGGELGGTLRVSGAVQDFSTGAGVPGVTIAFGDATGMTNAAGMYSIPLPAIGTYFPTLDGTRVGISHVTGASYRGDFLARTGTCVARYGTVSDLALHRPIPGAKVSLAEKTTVTDADGWYRLDFGCPPEGWVGFNTIFIYITHTGHADTSQSVGRGIFGAARLDIDMQRN